MGITNQLARAYRVEVSIDNTNWVRFNGLNDTNPDIAPNLQDSTNYESDGWATSEVTLYAWKLALKANRQANSGVEDPAFTMARACVGQFGDAARLYVRWYRRDGIPEAWTGRAIVGVSKSKTGVADLDEWTVTFTGSGALSPIANPYAVAVAPTVVAATPAGAAAGAQVLITGSSFTGATGVKFGAVSATVFTVLGDGAIVAVVPAGSAGSAPVTVINATGTSNVLAYTRA